MDYMRNSQRSNINGCRTNQASGCGRGTAGAGQMRIPEPCRMPARDSGSRSNTEEGCMTRPQPCPPIGPIGMTYVPWQKWRGDNIFGLEEGLMHATIFKDLVLPFEFEGPGCRKRGGCR